MYLVLDLETTYFERGEIDFSKIKPLFIGCLEVKKIERRRDEDWYKVKYKYFIWEQIDKFFEYFINLEDIKIIVCGFNLLRFDLPLLILKADVNRSLLIEFLNKWNKLFQKDLFLFLDMLTGRRMKKEEYFEFFGIEYKSKNLKNEISNIDDLIRYNKNELIKYWELWYRINCLILGLRDVITHEKEKCDNIAKRKLKIIEGE